MIGKIPRHGVPWQPPRVTPEPVFLNGTAQSDRLEGTRWNDTLKGGGGADILIGGGGRDTVSYFDSAVGVHVDLRAGVGRGGTAAGDRYNSIENVTGSEHDDLLVGNEEGNDLYGNDGDDTFIGGGGPDRFFGGEGIDTADYSQGGGLGGVTVDLETGRAQDDPNAAHHDTLDGIENIVGTGRGDILSGDANDNMIDGGGLNDQLFGRDGNDTLLGGTGNDTMYGGDGDDSLEGGFGNDLLFGEGDNDDLVGGAGVDELDGGDGDDNLDGGDDADILSGGLGNDIMTGGRDADVFRFADQRVLGPNDEVDTITDFERGVDTIEIGGRGGVSGFGDLTITGIWEGGTEVYNWSFAPGQGWTYQRSFTPLRQTGVEITSDDPSFGTLIVEGVTALSASDFNFV